MAFTPDGIVIAGAVDGSMSAAAGAEPGDLLMAIDGAPTRTLVELSAALRAAGGRDRAQLRFSRAGQTRSATVPVQPHPRESIPGQRVQYEQLDVPGARLRCIVTEPGDRPPSAAVVVMQGIACESVDFGASPNQPLAGLVHGWARAGLLTMRVDKRGVGDSDGPSCRDSDFETELADHRAALERLRSDPRASGVPIAVFGHSVGGMAAAALCGDIEVAGIVVYGTSATAWLDCIEATTRRQMAMRGVADDDVDRHIDRMRARVATNGLNGRCADYHRQLDAVDLPAVWSQVRAPVLIVRGEYDWVVSEREQSEIAELCAGDAQIADVAGLDHMMGWHPDLSASMTDYGAGRFDPAIVDATLGWLSTALL